ncbi:MAG: CAP domain-containing protein [Defluviitaleaceae bacterium]|nr:CAP domain-containing protein [Defluviitaleaceae bacterium]
MRKMDGILSVFLTASMVFLISFPVFAGTIHTDHTYGRIARFFGNRLIYVPYSYYGGYQAAEEGNVSAFLTDAQIYMLISQAPPAEDTASSMTLPDRILTDAELERWIDEYYELGGMNSLELQVVKMINAERSRAGIPILAINNELMKASRFKSHSMADLRYFSHFNPVYSTDVYRLFDHQNIDDLTLGIAENLYRGNIAPETVVQAWMYSPSHRRNILDPQAKTIGVGFVDRHITAKFGY